MIAGASTACFYPLETEKSLKQVGELGFKKTEIFLNALQEMEQPFINELNAIKNEQNIEIVSVHPFSSFLESSCIFGDYKRRFLDFLSVYEKTCYCAAQLGAKFVVIHGAVANPKIPIPDERYFERFFRLIELGKREGVIVCQENVHRFKSQSIEFCEKMRGAIGTDFKMVFDIKQTVRAGEDTFSFMETFADDIVHVHISDHNSQKDCLPPGTGTFDFEKMYSILGTRADYVIEIYSDNFNVESELKKSKAFLGRI